MIIVPLIITSIIVGITNINDKATIGRLGRKTFGYYLLTSTNSYHYRFSPCESSKTWR